MVEVGWPVLVMPYVIETDVEPCVDVLAGACQGVYAVRRWRLAYILGDGKVDYKKRDMPKGFDL